MSSWDEKQKKQYDEQLIKEKDELLFFIISFWSFLSSGIWYGSYKRGFEQYFKCKYAINYSIKILVIKSWEIFAKF